MKTPLDPHRNDNDLTLKSYQAQTQAYIDKTPHIDETTRAWIDELTSLMPRPGKILEIGSSFGRDAQYLRDQGFNIECSDAVPNFVKILTEKGFKARLLNILTEPIEGPYDLIIAHAVLLHFTPEEALRAARNARAALNKDGVFGFSVKKGEGSIWTDEKLGEPRFFQYWQEQGLKALVKSADLTWLSAHESYTSHNNATWIHVIAKA